MRCLLKRTAWEISTLRPLFLSRWDLKSPFLPSGSLEVWFYIEIFPNLLTICQITFSSLKFVLCGADVTWMSFSLSKNWLICYKLFDLKRANSWDKPWNHAEQRGHYSWSLKVWSIMIRKLIHIYLLRPHILTFSYYINPKNLRTLSPWRFPYLSLPKSV